MEMRGHLQGGTGGHVRVSFALCVWKLYSWRSEWVATRQVRCCYRTAGIYSARVSEANKWALGLRVECLLYASATDEMTAASTSRVIAKEGGQLSQISRADTTRKTDSKCQCTQFLRAQAPQNSIPVDVATKSGE